jgi:transcriptional regulator with XRE-family HTH domain
MSRNTALVDYDHLGVRGIRIGHLRAPGGGSGCGLSWCYIINIIKIIMSTEFALDLKVARRKAGFTQNDLAHLLGSNQAHISELERGLVMPTIEQIVTLSIIYSRSFEGLYAALLADARGGLKARIVEMPVGGRSYVGTFNRDASIERLARRLADEIADNGAA